MGHSDRILVSKPHRVIWCGFETDTRRLQQQGWELAVDQDRYSMGIRMVLRHQEMQCIGITNSVEYWRLAEQDLRGSSSGPHGGLLTFHVIRMGHNLRFEILRDSAQTTYVTPSFNQIDAQMQFVSEIKNLEDYCVFATPLVRTEELIVDPDEVGILLEKLKQAQLPEQEAIRKRKQMRESRAGLQLEADPRMNFHAQILSIAA